MPELLMPELLMPVRGAAKRFQPPMNADERG
jgi:hypothetical protein